MSNYDSTADTLKHIKRVNQLLLKVSEELIKRAQVHDDSKLVDPEKALFDIYTPKLKDVTYGSPEYQQFLVELKPALDHHYAKNSHHPEHYPDGVNEMDLIDLIEMMVDWKASSERHTDGNILKSLEINAKRFGMTKQLEGILYNTIIRSDW